MAVPLLCLLVSVPSCISCTDPRQACCLWLLHEMKFLNCLESFWLAVAIFLPHSMVPLFTPCLVPIPHHKPHFDQRLSHIHLCKHQAPFLSSLITQNTVSDSLTVKNNDIKINVFRLHPNLLLTQHSQGSFLHCMIFLSFTEQQLGEKRSPCTNS